MKKISIGQAIIDAIDETDESAGRHMSTLLKWARYCEKSIGSINGYPFKSIAVIVDGAEIVKPADCYRVVAIYPGDLTGIVNLRYNDISGVMVNVENISDDNDLEYVWQGLPSGHYSQELWDEIGDVISLANVFTGQKVTILYQYIETDVNGYWLVNDTHIKAISDYLVYMISKKFMFRNFKSDKLTRAADMQMVDTYKNNYRISIRNARAEDSDASSIR